MNVAGAGLRIRCPKCTAEIALPPAVPKQDSTPSIFDDIGTLDEALRQDAPPFVPSTYPSPVPSPPPGGRDSDSPSAASSRKTRPKYRLAALAFGVLSLVLLAALILLVVYWLRRSPDTVPPPPSLPDPVIGIALDDVDRESISIKINGELKEVPKQGPVEYSIPSGHYHVLIERKGYEPWNYDGQLEAGERSTLKPQWPPPPPPKFHDWQQDLTEAQKIGSATRKDILIFFAESEPTNESRRLASEVFLQQEFRDRITDYVLVYLGLSQPPEDWEKVQNPERNKIMKEQYGIDRTPTVIFADNKGRPYGFIEGYRAGGVDSFFDSLKEWQFVGKELGDRYLEIERGSLEEQARAADEALNLLDSRGVRKFCPHWWIQGLEEKKRGDGPILVLTWYLWQGCFSEVRPSKPNDVKRLVEKFDNWKKTHPPDDADLAAHVHYLAARVLFDTGHYEASAQKREEGLACNPTSAVIKRRLEKLRAPSTRGAGFCVASETLASGTTAWYILTAYHVIDEVELVAVQFEGQDRQVPAERVAVDSKDDVALLKISLPSGPNVKPIPLISGLLPGMPVCTLGYPNIGPEETHLTLTGGMVSSLPEDREDRMIVTDVRVNPGNSGGPLLSDQGGAIGMMARKTLITSSSDSLGLAIPAGRLRRFLENTLPASAKLPPEGTGTRNLAPTELNKMFSSSVVRVQRRADSRTQDVPSGGPGVGANAPALPN